MSPTPHYVYRQFSSTGTLLYVGATADWSRREGDHLRNSPWRAEIARTEVTEYPSRDVALAYEALAIETEGPLYNQIGAPDGRAAKDRRVNAHRRARGLALTLPPSQVQRPPEAIYTTPQAQVRAGVTTRQIDYWARKGIVEPTVKASGSGSRRYWSLSDLTVIEAVGRVSASTSPDEVLRQVAAAVRSSDGSAVMVQLGDGVTLTVATRAFEADGEQGAA